MQLVIIKDFIRGVVMGFVFSTIIALFGYIAYWNIPEPYQHPKLRQMAEDYKIDAAKYGIKANLSILRRIDFANMEQFSNTTIGFGLTPHVLIDKSYADTLTDEKLKEVVYHELTHSVLGCVNHTQEPSSLMHADGSFIKEEWEVAVKKLFTKDIQQLFCYRL